MKNVVKYDVYLDILLMVSICVIKYRGGRRDEEEEEEGERREGISTYTYT